MNKLDTILSPGAIELNAKIAAKQEEQAHKLQMKIPKGYTLDIVEDYRNIDGDLYHRYRSDPIDKGDYILRKHLSVYFERDGITVNRKYTNTFKEQKFLCVNGPLEGQKHTINSAAEQGYAQYNRGSDYKELSKNPKCILVHFNNKSN